MPRSISVGGTFQAGSTFSTSVPIVFGAAESYAVFDTSGSTLTLSGGLSGDGGLVKSGRRMPDPERQRWLCRRHDRRDGHALRDELQCPAPRVELDSGLRREVRLRRLVPDSSVASPASLAAVPEPGTLALLAVAGIVAAAAWRRRKN